MAARAVENVLPSGGGGSGRERPGEFGSRAEEPAIWKVHPSLRRRRPRGSSGGVAPGVNQATGAKLQSSAEAVTARRAVQRRRPIRAQK